MKNNTDLITDCLAAVFTATQTNELFQLISLILTCISVSLGIIFRIISWYRKSTGDKEISKEEFKEGIDIIQDGIEELSKIVDKDKGDKK